MSTYTMVMLTSMAVGLSFVGWLIICELRVVYDCFVDEQKYKPSIRFKDTGCGDGGSVAFLLFIMTIIVVVASAAWPVGVPVVGIWWFTVDKALRERNRNREWKKNNKSAIKL